MQHHRDSTTNPEQLVDALFRRQHAVAADRQIRALGVTWERQRILLRSTTWSRYAPGVVSLSGAPRTWEQGAMAATLGSAGLSLVCGRSAARLHRLDGFADTSVTEIVLPYGGHDRTAPDVTVRWSRRLSLKDRHLIKEIPVTIIPVTLIHLAEWGSAAEQALDSALRQRKPPLWLQQHFQRWAAMGASGAGLMLQLLDERMGKRLPRSWFQRLASRAITERGVELVDEWPVHDANGKLLAELDLADVRRKVGLECQSIEYHASAADVAQDVQRKRMLRRLGWDIVELWWSDLERMDDVMADLHAALDRADNVPA